MTEVYKAIVAVQGELAKEGIAKSRKNDQQNYRFRGIDEVYNALSPLLAKYNLCILPRMISRDVVERKNAKGTALFYITLEAEFDFVSAVDGSKHTVRTYGEAMDSGDKATNKAMSAAYKYAAFQTFAIPTEGDNDSEVSDMEAVSLITELQLSELRELIESTDADIRALCGYYKIGSLPELPESKFAHAKGVLEKRKKGGE